MVILIEKEETRKEGKRKGRKRELTQSASASKEPVPLRRRSGSSIHLYQRLRQHFVSSNVRTRRMHSRQLSFVLIAIVVVVVAVDIVALVVVVDAASARIMKAVSARIVKAVSARIVKAASGPRRRFYIHPALFASGPVRSCHFGRCPSEMLSSAFSSCSCSCSCSF